MTDLTDLSRAIDEIYQLRLLLASEARILEAHLDFKTFPKSRRQIAEESVARLRSGALGNPSPVNPGRAKQEYRILSGSQTLTNSQWRSERETAGGSEQ